MEKSVSALAETSGFARVHLRGTREALARFSICLPAHPTRYECVAGKAKQAHGENWRLRVAGHNRTFSVPDQQFEELKMNNNSNLKSKIQSASLPLGLGFNPEWAASPAEVAAHQSCVLAGALFASIQKTRSAPKQLRFNRQLYDD